MKPVTAAAASCQDTTPTTGARSQAKGVATVAKITYNGNDVTQTIIINEDYGYNITATKRPDISEKMSKIFDDIVLSFVLN